jgi:hypothetical protein
MAVAVDTVDRLAPIFHLLVALALRTWWSIQE